MIDFDEFFEAVREMRSWQRAFFKAPKESAKRGEAYQQAYRCERIVDGMIEEIDERVTNPPLPLEG